MSSKTIWIIVIVILLAGGLWWWYASNGSSTRSSSPSTSYQNTSNTGDASLTADLAAVNVALQGLSSDSAQIDQSVSAAQKP